MPMKKAQMQQIFVYVLGVVIMGMLVLFAFKGIKSIMITSEKADLEKFKTDFAVMIDEMSAYGRGRVDTVKTPGGFGKLCLIGRENIKTTEEQPVLLPDELTDIVKESIRAGSDNNVYLVSVEGSTIEAFKTDPMEVLPVTSCFDVSNNKIKLRLQGFTKYTRVEEVQQTA